MLEPGCELGEALFVSELGFVEFRPRSVPLLESGFAVLLLFVEFTLGLLGVVLLPGVVLGVDDEPGYVLPGLVEVPAPGVPGDVPGAVCPHVKELRQMPRAGTSKNASLFFILLAP
ncbi:MAG TPA: hypothetical protein VHC90_13595 [Bryobacteraceae bacterium]|nr:hypothetical protein [Bryobacteraceae bacterium]